MEKLWIWSRICLGLTKCPHIHQFAVIFMKLIKSNSNIPADSQEEQLYSCNNHMHSHSPYWHSVCLVKTAWISLSKFVMSPSLNSFKISLRTVLLRDMFSSALQVYRNKPTCWNSGKASRGPKPQTTIRTHLQLWWWQNKKASQRSKFVWPQPGIKLMPDRLLTTSLISSAPWATADFLLLSMQAPYP